MSQRRILSLWFPHLAVEVVLRREPSLADLPTAVAEDQNGRQILSAMTAAAEQAGLTVGMALTDARAICPNLVSRPADPLRQADMLTILCRWAGRFSPWVAEDAPDALRADLTGCAHLFGGEAALAERICTECAQMGLTARCGIANTYGAAWAVTRFSQMTRSMLGFGDAIDQEARATRSRAARRRRPVAEEPLTQNYRIVAIDQTRRALAPLPVAALRLQPDVVTTLTQLGLRQVGDLAGMPRASLARRFGIDTVRRLDQAFGSEPEPVSPAEAPLHFATRLNLPEPVGLETDILAGIDRLLPPLCARLHKAGRGVRRLRFTATRTDHRSETIEIGLALPTNDPARLRPLLALQTGRIEAGFGIDRLRMHAYVTEPLTAAQHTGPTKALSSAGSPEAAAETAEVGALIDRLGARLGAEALTRLHPADSHIPEKSATVMAAAFSAPAMAWPARPPSRPLQLHTPERVTSLDIGTPPELFRWRRRDHRVVSASGPERITPEWWLDDPAWRSGARDYWRVETEGGARLWLFETRGTDHAGQWFVHGNFG